MPKAPSLVENDFDSYICAAYQLACGYYAKPGRKIPAAVWSELNSIDMWRRKPTNRCRTVTVGEATEWYLQSKIEYLRKIAA